MSRSAATPSAAQEAFIYIRGEYIVAADRLDAAIAEAREAGLLGENILGTRSTSRSTSSAAPGAYICGEETALLESLEGRRPMPRSRPPFPAVEGLYRRPTCVNNVETLANVPHILAQRAAPGTTAIGVAAAEHRPEDLLPLGRRESPRQLRAAARRGDVPRADRGLRRRHDRRPQDQGRAARRHLGPDRCPSAQLDAKLDYDSVAAAGSMLGSASLIVLDETVCIVAGRGPDGGVLPQRIVRQVHAVPRGHQWLHKVAGPASSEGGAREADLDLLLSLSGEISGKVPVRTGRLRHQPGHRHDQHFRDEYLEHFGSGHCLR